MMLATVSLVVLALLGSCAADYNVGVGIYDITGPVVDVPIVGYYKISQVTCGIHLRIFSRAFIIDDGNNRVVYVSAGILAANTGVKKEVIRRLNILYDGVYTQENVIISGSNTHGSPGGYLQDFLYDLPTKGYSSESFDAVTTGITQSIVKAHESIAPARIYVNSATLLGVTVNRSPAAYVLNPYAERQQYPYDTDKDLVQLKIVSSANNATVGVINWFAIHATSMNSSNCLVTSGNVGHASILLEQYLNGFHLPGENAYVGVFASSNLGDVSPNINGPTCINTGAQCDAVTSSCFGSSAECVATGPSDNTYESTEIVGEILYNKSIELLQSDTEVEVTGPIKLIHQFVNVPNQQVSVQLSNGTTVQAKGCTPAIGYSFAAGTTDGPGIPTITQGTLNEDPAISLITDLLSKPTDEETACQAPKPILLNTGDITEPYEWQPSVVATQVVAIGSVVIAAVPGEFTTMAGRRLRTAINETFISNNQDPPAQIIISGLSNTYIGSVATREEYQLQRYEGAFTIFGQWTLDIFLSKYKELTAALINGETLSPGPTPPAFPDNLVTFIPEVEPDIAGSRGDFGTVTLQPNETVSIDTTVEVKWVAGNLRNYIVLGGTYVSVEYANGSNWQVVAVDAVWTTQTIWERLDEPGESELTLFWEPDDSVPLGTYRIRHLGAHKTLSGSIVPYVGITNNFTVEA